MAAPVVTYPKYLLQNKPNAPSSLFNNQRVVAGRRSNSVRVNAIAKKWEPSKVVPQADRVLVRLEELSEKSAGGLLLPHAAVKFEPVLMGEILSVGADVQDVGAGKKVLFSNKSAYEVQLGSDARHCFVNASNLLAVVE